MKATALGGPPQLVVHTSRGEPNVAARQRALRLVIDAVMLRSIGQGSMPIGDRTVILKRGAAPADLPRRGRRVPLAPFPWPDRLPDGAGEVVGEDLGEPLGEG
ncbi:MAG TPA: hypothetical protein VK631_06695 [Solirubrobacteraceae bacterium]|nr:hypothetical protein [Solirubrobacteraceae bacterium]